MTDPDTTTAAIITLESFGEEFLVLYHRLHADEVQTAQWQPGQSPRVSVEDFAIRAKYSTSDPVWVAVSDDRRWALREAVAAGERALTKAHRSMQSTIEMLEAVQAQSGLQED